MDLLDLISGRKPIDLKKSMTDFLDSEFDPTNQYAQYGLKSPIRKGDVVGMGLDVAPGVGDVKSLIEALQAAGKGNFGEAAVMGMGALPLIPAMGGAIKVSHGSPHAHTGFDMSKIGTGEGAQAYGHGLYFGQGYDSPVAIDYQYDLSRNAGLEPTIDGAPLYDFYKKIEQQANKLPPAKAGAEYEKLSFLEDLGMQHNFDRTLERVDDPSVLPWAKSLRGRYQPAGYMYNVDLKWPDAAREASDPMGGKHFLDLDKEYTKQSKEVKEILKREGIMKGYRANLSDFGTPSDTRNRLARGQNILAYLEMTKGGPAEASAYLNEIGIPGNRYLDQGSRDRGRGTHNYVVFDDKIPEIVTRNGTSLLDLLRGK